MKVRPGLGGMGAVTMMEPEKPHPANHYEINEMRIQKAKSGGYVIHHHMALKKKFAGKPGYQTGYETRNPEPEMHTAADSKELMAHIKKHFGASKEMVPQASAEDEMGEREDEGAE